MLGGQLKDDLMAHLDPRGQRAAADKDFGDDMGIVEDFIHIGGALWRLLTWPLRLLGRLLRR